MNKLLIAGFRTKTYVNKRRSVIENKLDNQRYEFYPHQIKHDLVIIDKSSKLQFNIPEFEIKREDTLEIRNKILSLTPEDRKRLNINKSTLWYIQKHVR
jgi:CRISPR-associated protein Cas1